MDPLVIILLAVFIGIPVLSLIVVGLFAVSADFKFVEVRVRGGRLRGAVAAAVAKVLVKDAASIQLPLVVVLEKTGALGGSTPLFGGATVRDIECEIFMDDEHVSTVTEARSTHIDSFQRILELPINVDIHLPQGVIRTYRDYRAKKRRSAEVKLTVRGHVLVRHWWITRQIPVRVSRNVVLGEPVPRLVGIRWRAVGGDGDVWDRAVAEVHLANGYQDEELEGRIRFELRQRRRVIPDVLLATHEHMRLTLRPGRSRSFFFRIGFVVADDEIEAPLPPLEADESGHGQAADMVLVPQDRPPGATGPPVGGDAEPKGVPVVLRVFWGDRELTPEEVRVLGVPGARHGPRLALLLDGRGRRRRGLVARLQPEGPYSD